MERSPINEVREQPRYVYQSWPAWYNGPGGQRRIFNAEHEVPEGWSRNADEVKETEEEGLGFEKPRELNNDERTAIVDKLMDNNTQEALVAKLEEMQKLDESIEFSPRWPKQKLAETIADNGGPLEENEED